jgi:phospholipid/cholesterol/gamma-HCH transport system substrate-binding protein
MKGFRDRNPYAVGLTSVLAIGTIVGLAFMVGILHLGEKKYTLTGAFSDAGGLHNGDSVRVAGIKAGRVTKISADRTHGLVIVKWIVKKGVNLGPDTHAEIALETLLGRKFIRLTGPVVRPYLADGPASARRIPRERTKTPFDLFDLVKLGTREVEATETEKLNQFITQLAAVTEGKQAQVRDLLDGLAKVSAAVNQRDNQLRQLLDRVDSVSKTLADKDQTIVSLIDQSQGVLELVQQRRDDIAAGLRNSDKLFSGLGGILGTNKSSIDAILQTLHPTLDVLDQRQADLDRTLSWLGSGALGLSKAASHGPWADIYVRGVGPDVIGVLGSLLRAGAP